jgi:2-dehydropantoate 2-reductase
VRLALAGERVVCLARRETVAAISHEGLTLIEDGSERIARPEASEALDEPVELLLVTVKAPGLDEALERVRSEPYLVLPLLNGLDHMATLRERFGNVIAATIGQFEAHRESVTRIVQQTPGVVTVAGEPPEQLERAGIATRSGGSEKDVLWEKLARQAPIAVLTSATRQAIGELRSDPRLRLAVEEACAVATADGAKTTFAEQWEVVASLPAWATSSTARDVAADLPSELDAIGGAVVRAGRRLGVPTPVLEEVISLCRP